MTAISILFEDEYLLLVNKPAGFLSHALTQKSGAKNQVLEEKTNFSVVDWLIEKYPELEELSWPDSSRPGLVHRLDRDTSGLLLLAKTPQILAALQEQFHDRLVKKTYLCLVSGRPDWQEKTVIAAVSRGEGTRRQAHYLKLDGQAKDAETSFKVIKTFIVANSEISLVEAKPLTGRTHQIRVHLGLEGFPILGDPWYQTKSSRNLAKTLAIPRLMLHAQKLTFTQPITKQIVTIEAPLPLDMDEVIGRLRNQGI